MRLFYTLLLSFLCLCLNAQNNNNVTCDFTQTKHSSMFAEPVVSTGKMYFCQPDKLRWEYITPVQTIFIMDGEEAMVIAGGRSKKVDMGKNGLYRSIVDIMSAGLSEGAGRYEVKKSGNTMIMKPLRKDMKRVFSSVTIVLAEDDFPKSVVISERNGDSTTIEFTDINTLDIDNSVFNY